MPDGAVDSGDENPGLREADDPHAALDINLDESVFYLYKKVFICCYKWKSLQFYFFSFYFHSSARNDVI